MPVAELDVRTNPETEIVGVEGIGFTVTVATAVFKHPTASVPVTVYEVVVVGETVIGFVVSPPDHEYVDPPLAVNVADAPEHIVVEFTVMIGFGPIVTVATAVLTQPAASVPVTVYDVVEIGVTVIGLLLAPVLHEYVEPPLAVNVAVAPEHIVGEFTVIVGLGPIVTVETAVLTQPAASVPVTV